MNPQPPHTNPRDNDRLIYAGLLGLGAAFIIQLIDKTDLDVAQTVGLFSFAVAIPILATGLLTDYERRSGAKIPGWYDLIGLTGVLGVVVGLAAMLFHFGIWVGVTFLSSCALGFILIRRL